ncbi:hypothetical protein [Roseiflexus sp.]|uniref:hypothetical protein n=1 Tax=Roseiflexus sp. TaxID=2562120 RepID=UPI00398B03A6
MANWRVVAGVALIVWREWFHLIYAELTRVVAGRRRRRLERRCAVHRGETPPAVSTARG